MAIFAFALHLVVAYGFLFFLPPGILLPATRRQWETVAAGAATITSHIIIVATHRMEVAGWLLVYRMAGALPGRPVHKKLILFFIMWAMPLVLAWCSDNMKAKGPAGGEHA